MNVLCKATLFCESGIPEDAVTNSFAVCQVDDLTAPTLDAIWTAIKNFYITQPTGAIIPLSDCLSPGLANGVDSARIDLYDLTGHEGGVGLMGPPIKTDTFNLPAPAAGTALPTEVACCFTLEAVGRAAAAVEVADDGDAGSEPNRPKQRHTGRLFIGPLNTTCIQLVAGQPRPSSSLRDTGNLAVKELDADLAVNAGGAHLGVWSRKDATVREVDHVSCDDSFDTQRRRGSIVTARTRIVV